MKYIAITFPQLRRHAYTFFIEGAGLFRSKNCKQKLCHITMEYDIHTIFFFISIIYG